MIIMMMMSDDEGDVKVMIWDIIFIMNCRPKQDLKFDAGLKLEKFHTTLFSTDKT